MLPGDMVFQHVDSTFVCLHSCGSVFAGLVTKDCLCWPLGGGVRRFFSSCRPFQASVDSELLLREVAGDECHLSCSQEGKQESWSPCCCHDHDVIAWVCDYARRASEEAPSQMQFSLRIQTEVAVDAQQPGRGDEHGSNAHHSWRCTCIHLRYKNNNLKII